MTEQKKREFYTVEDMVEILPIHQATVRRWLSDGTLKGKKVKRKWFISAEDVERLKEEIKKGGKPSDPLPEGRAVSFANARYAR